MGKLLAIIHCKSISAVILDCEVSTNGILGDFYYVISYNILTYSEKNQLVTNLFNVEHNGPGLRDD